MKNYVSKCGIAIISISKKLAQCASAKDEIKLLNDILHEAGLRGTPTLEKCAAIKQKRDLQKEVEGLDTSLIIKDGGGRSTRTRQRGSKPVYTVDVPSSEEEEEEEEDEESSEEDDEEEEAYSEDDAKSDDGEPAKKKSPKKSSKKSKARSDDDESEDFSDED